MSNSLSHLKSLGKKLGLAFFIFSLSRVMFVLFNTEHFNDISLSLFFYGIRFDMVSLSYIMSPLVIFHLVPLNIRNYNWYQKLLKWLFYLPLILGIAINSLDLGYFQYTLKRTTFDFFDMVGTGDDFWKLLPNYILDFWYAYAIFAFLLWLTVFLYKRFCQKDLSFIEYRAKDYFYHTLYFVLSIGLLIIGMRGGIQYKPIDIVNAGQYATAQNTPIVLNTPFTIFKTIFTEKLAPISYYTDEELEKIYTPKKKITSKEILANKNVVIIILESYSKEYIGALNKGNGYTPFLDSLIQHSYVFNNAYANGQRSIESLPGIFAGLPQLMGTPYSTSSYASDKLDALPQLLKENGYNTSFYHGGANGTMGFNGFVGSIGVDDYFGMDEYPENEKNYDGKWGIYDEPYLQYFAEQLSTKTEPFFSSIFTLSSHHPYPIPKEHKNKFPKGNLPIHETIGYSDFALKEFFNTVKSEPWFNNTIFVFTADHSSQCENQFYKSNLNRFAIPTILYAPGTALVGINNDYFQQIDITPTILSLLGINNEIISFGNNAFDDSEKYALNYISGSYQIATENHFLVFDGDNTTEFYNLKTDSLMSKNIVNELKGIELKKKNNIEQKLKAIIQQYNNRMINNQLSISNQ